MARNNDNIALLMVGDSEGEIPDSIKPIIKHERIIFTGYTNEVNKYMAACDVLAHPSYREGFSMVIQEAMAMKCLLKVKNIPEH